MESMPCNYGNDVHGVCAFVHVVGNAAVDAVEVRVIFVDVEYHIAK